MKYLVSLIVFSFSALLVPAQQASGAIKGVVVDQHGAVIPSAQVSLRREGEQMTKSLMETRTGGDGRYYFSGIAPGNYEIVVKADWFNRTFRKALKLPSSQSNAADIVFSLEPCFEDGAAEKAGEPTEEIREQVVRELFDVHFRKQSSNLKKDLIFVPANIRLAWLTAAQRSRLSVMTRDEVQSLTERSGSVSYFSVSKMTQRGNCVAVSMLENVTIKGQIEDANMAGGGTTYEFRKINDRWIGEVLTGWIS